MSAPVQIPELLRADLVKLYAAKQQADRDYRMVLNAGLIGMGVDPREVADVNLDTGTVAFAAKKQEGKKQDNPA